MQLSRPAVALLSLALSGAHASEESGMNPVSRVVQLLKGISTRIEQDGKEEEDLYETFVCWAKSMISQKTKSNSEAQTRVDYLATFIDDLKNGRIELTTERVDLEKEIAALTSDIEGATRLREQEAADYEDAKAEMEAAVKALEEAIQVLETATKDHKEGVLLRVTGGVSAGNAERAKEAASLHRAVELGQRVLTKGDSVFLARLLVGEEPVKKDWKKLNRKATFKMNYKARSSKIQGVLADLLETFEGDLKDATAKEDNAIEIYDKLMKAKGDEKTTAQDALVKMDKENGARTMSMDEAVAEKDALETQITDDKKYITEVEKARDDKKAEWKTRKELRTGEIAAISKAISILHSDDARDLFKRSYASQGLLFLQQGSQVSSGRGQGAADALRLAAKKSHNARLQALAIMASQGDSDFTEVIAAIDKMVTDLKAEEKTDLDNKEGCEKDRAADTRDAIKTSREIDELSDGITALEAKIEEVSAEIKTKEERIVEIEAELKELKEQRDKENKEYVKAKKDDEDAAALVEQSKGVLESFYKDNGLMLVQHSGKQPFESEAGEAPPPPPKTWEGDYGGKTGESGGIIAILTMVKDDIEKDIATADATEKDAVDLYTKTKTDLGDEKTKLDTSISDLTTVRSGHISDVETKTKDRSTKKGELAVVVKKIQDAAPGCDFIMINYAVRSQNRQIEMDGLQKAKAILSGAKFDAPDENRELKPGDAALMQGNLRASKISRH